MPRQRPFFSIIIPNLNGEAFLGACLRSIREAAHSCLVEVLIIDNGSTDRSVEIAREALREAQILSNETNEGYARACNQGASVASGSYLLFLNSDVWLSPDCLAQLRAWVQGDTTAAAWQPKLLRQDGCKWDSAGSFFTVTGFLWHEGLDVEGAERFPASRNVFSVKGACMAVRRETFLALGGFDDEFFAYFEETDFCWRLHLAGWKVRYVPACCVLHSVGATTTHYFRPEEIDFLSFRNRLMSILKNSERTTLLRVLPLHIVCCSGVCLSFVMLGRWRSAHAIIRAMVWPVMHRREVAVKRGLTQALRTESDVDYLPEVTMRMTRGRARKLLASYLPRW